jgi:hypothetical protein
VNDGDGSDDDDDEDARRFSSVRDATAVGRRAVALVADVDCALFRHAGARQA